MNQTPIQRIRAGELLGDVLGNVPESTPIGDVIDLIRAYLETTKLIDSSGRDDMVREAIHIALPHHAYHPDVIEAINAECFRRIGKRMIETMGDRVYFGPSAGDGIPRYELIRELGVGSQGTVWHAIDREFPGGDRSEVAIKILDDKTEESVRARYVEHPNVVHVYDQGRTSGRNSKSYIVYEYIYGPTLDQWAGGKTLSQREVTTLLVQIAEGVQAIHAQFISHRDLKPSNIIMIKNRPVIVDFGISMGRDDDQVNAGSPMFMAPEQHTRLADSVLVDVYGIGAIGFWLSTGRAPNGDTNQQALESFEMDSAPDCGVVKGQLGRIIERCLDRYPSSRYQSIGELIYDLRASQEFLPTSFQKSRRESTKLLIMRQPLAAGILLTLIAALSVLLMRANNRIGVVEDRFDLQTKVFQSSMDHLRMASLSLQASGETPDPAIFWMISEMVKDYPDTWRQFESAVIGDTGELRTVKVIESARDDPEVPQFQLAYWYLVHARLQRGAGHQSDDVMRSYESARTNLAQVVGENNSVVAEWDEEIARYANSI